jgi:GMP synthase-like glutamine amidotransferase
MASIRPVLILQHGPLGPPGVLGDWLAEHGIPFDVHTAWCDPVPGDPTPYAAIASLGSQYSALSQEPGWIVDEIALLRRAAASGVPILGLCFGGQALAKALGGEVRQAAEPEVGWMEVETRAPDVVARGPWLQFHWDVFEPPADAELLAWTPAGPAAFRCGRHFGTQFHPEVTPEMADGWAQMIPDELAGLGVDPEELRRAGLEHAPNARRDAYRLFDAWWAGRSPAA